MWNNSDFSQQGYGYNEESEESENSQDSSQESEQSSQSSQSSVMESSQEEESSHHVNPWLRIQEEAIARHESRREALINEYEQNGDSNEVATVKANNALLPIYRKELRKVFLEDLQWMHAIKKNSTFRKVMETKNELKDTEGIDWLEATELAINKRKFLLNRLFNQQAVPEE